MINIDNLDHLTTYFVDKVVSNNFAKTARIIRAQSEQPVETVIFEEAGHRVPKAISMERIVSEVKFNSGMINSCDSQDLEHIRKTGELLRLGIISAEDHVQLVKEPSNRIEARQYQRTAWLNELTTLHLSIINTRLSDIYLKLGEEFFELGLSKWKRFIRSRFGIKPVVYTDNKNGLVDLILNANTTKPNNPRFCIVSTKISHELRYHNKLHLGFDGFRAGDKDRVIKIGTLKYPMVDVFIDTRFSDDCVVLGSYKEFNNSDVVVAVSPSAILKRTSYDDYSTTYTMINNIGVENLASTNLGKFTALSVKLEKKPFWKKLFFI